MHLPSLERERAREEAKNILIAILHDDVATTSGELELMSVKSEMFLLQNFH
jgi:hypothetical protein